MPFITGPARSLGRPIFLEELPAPTGDVFAASRAEDILRNPSSSADRLNEMRGGGVIGTVNELPPQLYEMERERYADDPAALDRFEEIYGAPPEPAMLSAEEARARIGALDLEIPDEGISEQYLELLIEARREEVQRHSRLARGSIGTLGELALIGQSIAVSALDPLNVAASFIPVVREARFARWVTRFGAGRARVARGAIEGTVGAAVVEPLVLAAARAEQSDYNLVDSVLNITFGTVLGGGLHLGAGAAADAVRRARGLPTLSERVARNQILDDIQQRIDDLPFRVREDAQRVAVAQLAGGQTVEVTPILRPTRAFADVFEPRLRDDLLGGTALDRAGQTTLAEMDVRSLRVPVTGERGNVITYRSRSVAEGIARETGPETRVQETADGHFVLTRPVEQELVRDADGTVRTFASEADARTAARAARFQGQRGRLEPVPISTDDGRRAFALAVDPESATLRGVRGAPGQAGDVTLRQRFPVAGGRTGLPPPSVATPHAAAPRPGELPILRAADGDRALPQEAVDRLRRPQDFDLTTPRTDEASEGERLAAEAPQVDESVEAEVIDLQAEIEAMRARGRLSETAEAELAAADARAADLQQAAQTYRAAGHCLAAE